MDRLNTYFCEYFSDATKPTATNLFLLVVTILTLDTFRSVRFAHSHVLSKLADTSLNAYYYTLRTDSYDHSRWGDTTVSKAVRVVPDSLGTQPLFLSIDDTMVEKFGKKFELCSKLFGHAAHNGSNYLNGHCMVSILLSFPVLKDGQIQYLSVPLGYRLWDKEKSKLEIATEIFFAKYQGESVQDFRFSLSEQIREQVFIASFANSLETTIKSNDLLNRLKHWMLQQM